MFPVLGEVLSQRYRLDRVVGEGATSRVFAGHDELLQREVAIKVLIVKAHAKTAEHAAKAKEEARLLAQLKHPHIVAIHDVGDTAAGAPFLVMELVTGLTLEEELQRSGPIAAERVLALLLPVMGALACAHDRGIVHRDIKPQNMALEALGSKKPRAKLFDFGVAQSRADAQGDGMAAVGTPAYMAPEQARASELGPYTDVWALGVVLFRALTGSFPFEATNVDELLTKIGRERAPSVASRAQEVPMRIALAVDRALERQPQRRYADARAFAQALVASAQQDGIRLPTDPDPIGLPDFGTWLRSASIESTAQSSSKRAVPAGVRADARRGRKLRIVAGALLMLSVGAGWWLSRATPVLPVSAQRIREQPQHTVPASAAIEQMPASAPPPGPISAQPTLAPAPEAPEKSAPQRPKTLPRPRPAARSASAPAPAAPSQAPALMLDWDG